MRVAGEIVPGDSEHMIRELLKAPPSGNERRSLYEVELDSLGGNVVEAVRLAQLIDSLFVDVTVPARAVCASSCFFLYLAGNTRRATGMDPSLAPGDYSLGQIAIHRPYLKALPAGPSAFQQAEHDQQNLISRAREYLINRQVPQYLVERMMQRPSNDAYVLTDEDLRQIGRYKPGFEELLVSRCNYVRALEEEYLFLPTAAPASRRNEFLSDNQNRVQDCAWKVIMAPHTNEERPKLLKRLRDGWRPWQTGTGSKGR